VNTLRYVVVTRCRSVVTSIVVDAILFGGAGGVVAHCCDRLLVTLT